MATISSTLTLVDNMTSKLNSIRDAVDEVQDSLNSISDEQENLDEFSWSTFLDNAEKAGKEMEKIGKNMTLAITDPLVRLGKKMYGNATDYEAAYVAMRKTVEGGRATEEQYEHIAEVAEKLSTETPMSYTELLGTAQDAGNAGVAIDQMEDFLTVYSALQYATDQHISGTNGIKAVASFLNITDGGVQDIEHFANSIAYLGVNANTTEDEILEMANRFASAATIAGFTKPQILGMAAAFESVGIRAEAGGSSAAKLIKQFQLSAEVGGQAQSVLDSIGQHFESGLDFSNYLAGMKKSDLVELADSLGMTTEAVQSMADSWLLLDQFAAVSGKTSSQFIDDWSKDPAQAVSDFFYGLNQLGDGGADSILATLDKMGLTEIRESNLIAAMATRPEMFSNMIAIALQGYEENISMWEQFEQQMGTQESKNEMLGNKLNNTMADFGQNLVKALQPALDVVSQILDKFNSLSESDQTALLETLGAIALLGPTLTVVGKAIEMISKIGQLAGKAGKIGDVFSKIGTFLTTTPAGPALLIAGAIAGIVAAIESIPTDAEKIWESLKDIQITVDEESVNETLAAIQKVKEAADQLKNPEVSAEYENTSAAVSMGYGTNTMYGKALGYEANKANSEIDTMIANYSKRLLEIESQIANATTEAEKAEYFGQYQVVEAEMNREVAARKRLYTEKVSELFNGMASQYPEAAAALERASSEYDLMGTVLQALNFDWDSYSDEEVAKADWDNLMKSMYSKAFDFGFMDESGYSKEQFMNLLDAGFINNFFWVNELYDQTMQGLKDSVQTVSDNPLLTGFMQSIFSDDFVMQNLDMTSLQGAFRGIVDALDFKSAFEQASANGNVDRFEKYLSQELLSSMTEAGQSVSAGVAEGISGNEGVATAAATTMGTDVINAGNSGLGVNSPSVYMIQSGMNVVQGLAQGITSGSGIAIAEITVVSNQTIIAAKAILTVAAGHSIGYNVAAGIASGIRSGSGMAAAAARALASSVISTLRASLQVHSPSRVTFGIGENTGVGFVNGILDNRTDAEKAVGRVVNTANKAWNTAAWSDIALFAGLENDQLLSDAKDAVKISDADIRKIRDLAEREVINHFTTAKVEVEMTNNNSISSNMDLDGIADYLGDKVTERLAAVAEGVYS